MLPEEIKASRFLKQVKAILIVIGAIKTETILDEKGWLSYFENDYSAIKAVKEDMEGYYVEFPFVRWADVSEAILKQ